MKARRIAANIAKLPELLMREQESRVERLFQILELSSRDTLDEQFPLWRGAELLRPSYMFAIQVSHVTGVTKNTNAIPICLFVC